MPFRTDRDRILMGLSFDKEESLGGVPCRKYALRDMASASTDEWSSILDGARPTE
jgi:hypothetical protein